MSTTEPLFAGGPTADQLATTPGSWFVPEHLRDYYRQAVEAFTPRQIVDREDIANGAWETGLIQARAQARHACGLPELRSHDRGFMPAKEAWPNDVRSLAGYLLHLDAVDTARRAHDTEQAHRRNEQLRLERDTCRICDTVDPSTIDGWCGDCRNTLKVICDEKINASADQRVTRLKTRRQLVEARIADHPEDLPQNLYFAIMRTERLN